MLHILNLRVALDDIQLELAEGLHQRDQFGKEDGKVSPGAAAGVDGDDSPQGLVPHAWQIEVLPDMAAGGGQPAAFAAVAGRDELLEHLLPGKRRFLELVKQCLDARREFPLRALHLLGRSDGAGAGTLHSLAANVWGVVLVHDNGIGLRSLVAIRLLGQAVATLSAIATPTVIRFGEDIVLVDVLVEAALAVAEGTAVFSVALAWRHAAPHGLPALLQVLQEAWQPLVDFLGGESAPVRVVGEHEGFAHLLVGEAEVDFQVSGDVE